MTKPLDPEIKALRAMVRAWDLMPDEGKQRGLEWFVSMVTGRTVTLPIPGLGEPE